MSLYPEENSQLRLKLLLLGIVSSVIQIEELKRPGTSGYLWAEIESGAKQGGLAAVANGMLSEREYSISEIGENDVENGMNYLGQKLGESLFKHIHDLPVGLRKPEMFLRAIEALITNLLNDKFKDSDPHGILDSFCEHVHMTLQNLEKRDPFKKNQDPFEVIAATIDKKVKAIVLGGGDDTAIFTGLADEMDNVWKILKQAPEGQMDQYCTKYEYFYKYMKIVETLAENLASGKIKPF